MCFASERSFLRSSASVVVCLRTRLLLLMFAVVVVILKVSSAAVALAVLAVLVVGVVGAVACRSVGSVWDLGESGVVVVASALTHAFLLYVESVLNALLVRVGQIVGLGAHEQKVNAAALLEYDEAVVWQATATLLLVVAVDANLDHLAVLAEKGLKLGIADLWAEVAHKDLLVVWVATLLRVLEIVEAAVVIARVVQRVTVGVGDVVELTTGASVLASRGGIFVDVAWLLLLILLRGSIRFWLLLLLLLWLLLLAVACRCCSLVVSTRLLLLLLLLLVGSVGRRVCLVQAAVLKRGLVLILLLLLWSVALLLGLLLRGVRVVGQVRVGLVGLK